MQNKTTYSLSESLRITLERLMKKDKKIILYGEGIDNAIIEIDNKERSLRSGMSSEVLIVIDNAEAFLVSPAHLAINDDGSLKVKTVDNDNRVKVVDVNLVRASGNMAFVSGLKDGDIMLTTGQAFVSEGEEVNIELEKGN